MSSTDSTISLTQDQFQQLLAAVGSGSKTLSAEEQAALIRLQAEENAKATKKALRPENEHAPGVSVYARPGGERDHPKGEYRCPTFWNGAKLGWETTPEEFDLVNQVEPGQYTCQRGDGASMVVDVAGERDPVTGKWRRIDIHFPTRGEQRHNLPSMASMLRTIVAQQKTATA